MKPEYCAEIRLPLKDSTKYVFSSGYAIGESLLLTCRHGLHHANMAANAKLRITWRNTRGISLEPELVDREAICWQNQDLDVAVIRCPCPHTRPEMRPQSIITAIKPKAAQRWQAGGYLAYLEDIEQEKEFNDPQGSVSKNFSDRNTLELWLDKGNVEDANLWQGFSGSSLFVGDKIADVILAANQGKQGKHLTAIAMAGLLQIDDDDGHRTLAEVLDWQVEDLRTKRQNRQFESMCSAIEDQTEVLAALVKALKPLLAEDENIEIESGSVVTAFNRQDNGAAMSCLIKAFRSLCKEKDKPITARIQQAAKLGEFAEAWLPVLFDYEDHLDMLRGALADPAHFLVEIPTNLALPTELMMAEADGDMARLELSASKLLISPMDLGAFYEPGLDEEGKERQRQIERLLGFCGRTPKNDDSGNTGSICREKSLLITKYGLNRQLYSSVSSVGINISNFMIIIDIMKFTTSN